MLRHNLNYSPNELQNLIDLILDSDSSNVTIGFDLIQSQGFHPKLNRPLAFCYVIQSHLFPNSLLKELKKEFELVLQKELRILSKYMNHSSLRNIRDGQWFEQLNILSQEYAPFLRNRPHLLFFIGSLANHFKDEQKYVLAERVYTTAIELGYTTPKICFSAGLLYQNDLDAWEKAQEMYEMVLEKDPNHYVAHNNIGQVYGHLGAYQKAEEHFLKALAIRPNFRYSLTALAYQYWKYEDRYDEAAELYEQLLENYPDNKYILPNYAGLLSQYLGEFSKAKKLLDKAIQLHPEYDYVWKVYGIFHSLTNPPDWEKTVQYLSKAHILDLEDDETADLLEEAKTHLEKI